MGSRPRPEFGLRNSTQKLATASNNTGLEAHARDGPNLKSWSLGRKSEKPEGQLNTSSGWLQSFVTIWNWISLQPPFLGWVPSPYKIKPTSNAPMHAEFTMAQNRSVIAIQFVLDRCPGDKRNFKLLKRFNIFNFFLPTFLSFCFWGSPSLA